VRVDDAVVGDRMRSRRRRVDGRRATPVPGDPADGTSVTKNPRNTTAGQFKRPLMPMNGGSRMILIDRCVDLKDATYRFLAGRALEGALGLER
jgi:hypothetical protein